MDGVEGWGDANHERLRRRLSTVGVLDGPSGSQQSGSSPAGTQRPSGKEAAVAVLPGELLTSCLHAAWWA